MSKIKIRPLHERVVIRQFEAETVSAGGIVMSGTTVEKPHEGEVLAIGKGKTLPSGEVIPMDVAVGDKVLFGQYVGQEATIDGEEYLILEQDEIIAILN